MYGAHPISQPNHPESLVAGARLRAATWWSVFLLLLLWGGYNTGIYVVLAPGFPASHTQLIQGVRAFFPLLAAWLAFLALLKKGGAKLWALAGPLGLFGIFAAAGLISSGLISKYPGQALYWGSMLAAVLVVLVAVCSEENSLAVLSRFITASWMVDIFILLGLLGAIPFLGGALAPTHGSPLGVKAYAHSGQMAVNGIVLGMSGTRNTGLARYAAVAGLVALARLWTAKPLRKLLWLLVLLVAIYTLVLAQARTETIGFFAGLAVILMLRKSRRIVLLGTGVLGVALLYLVGFFHGLWVFGTHARGGHHFDSTLTGRTGLWTEGLRTTMHSPWLGLGFQADRFYLHGAQLESAFFQALIQSGVLGTLAFLAAFALAWYLCIRLYTSRTGLTLPDEIPGILMFFTVMSITESTAFYGANWMLLAPVVAYIQVAAWQYGILGRRRLAFDRPSVPLTTRRTAPASASPFRAVLPPNSRP